MIKKKKEKKKEEFEKKRHEIWVTKHLPYTPGD